MKRIGRYLLSFFVTVCLCGAFSSLSIKTAKAEDSLTYASFTMEEGAAVRLVDGSNGLRFSAEISEMEYAALNDAGARFGMLIVANDIIGGNAANLTEETVFGKNPSFYFTNEEGGDTSKPAMLNVTASCQNIDEDTNVEICGSIVNIKTGNLTRPFVGVAYVAIPSASETVINEDGTTEKVVTDYEYHFAPYYGDDMANNTRCMYYVAQKAIEAGNNAAVLQTNYIEAFASRAEGKLYKYNVVHHYIAANGAETTETEVQGGALNATIGAQAKSKTGYVYDMERTASADKGLVYAAGMQTLHIYYKTGSAEELLKDLFGTTEESRLEASKKYCGGTLTLDENGNLISVDTGSTGLAGSGQITVVFTPEFIYELQRLGYTEIKADSISATSENTDLTISKVKLTGYVTATYEVKTTNGVSVTTAESISLDINKKIVQSETIDENGNMVYQYNYEDGTTAEGVSFQAISWLGSFLGDMQIFTSEWVFNNLSLE